MAKGEISKNMFKSKELFSKKELKEVEKEVEAFFEKMCFSIEIDDVALDDEALVVNLKSEEPRILIGERGRVLDHIQRLLKALFSRKFNKQFYLNVDINDYKKKKTQFLREMAREEADKVSLTKKEISLEPMLSYERRIIHLELAERPGIITESIGEGPERRVIVKPVTGNG